MTHSHHATARPRVLSVGQCGFDGPNIERLLGDHFDAEVDTACDMQQALQAVQSTRFDLVLINRIFDGNGESGIDLIRRLHDARKNGAPPVMLVSNYADAQQKAIELGARPGFGKNALQAPQTIERLAAVLGQCSSRQSGE